MTTYSDAVRFLYALGNEIHTAKLGLERISNLLRALGDPHRACRFVHVAGTNGKGSTSAMIEAGLRAGGVRTGLYTSPHLVEPTERIQIVGEPVSKEDFALAFEEVHSVAKDLIQRGEFDLHPTYFETITAMAFLIFRQFEVELAVLEVGLGGRLDATNVVEPELCVITLIDLDHQRFLGDTIAAIAREKAGILKPGVPALFAPQLPAAAAVLRECARGPYHFSCEWPIHGLQMDPYGSRFCLDGKPIVCPLAGEHQVENARTAAIALAELGFAADGIALTKWPGRLEHVAREPEIILDGAHNPAGVRALVRYIEQFYSGRRIWIVFGVMADKAVSEMTAMLFPLASRVIVTAPANSRAMPATKIPARNAIVAASVSEALEIARAAEPDDVVFITGSLFVVGEARGLLVK